MMVQGQTPTASLDLDKAIVETMLRMRQHYARLQTVTNVQQNLRNSLRAEARVVNSLLRDRSRSPAPICSRPKDDGESLRSLLLDAISEANSTNSPASAIPASAEIPASPPRTTTPTIVTMSSTSDSEQGPLSSRSASWWNALDWHEFCPALLKMIEEED